jgi:uncharacterized membrane protein YvlD (DUF360 family)
MVKLFKFFLNAIYMCMNVAQKLQRMHCSMSLLYPAFIGPFSYNLVMWIVSPCPQDLVLVDMSFFQKV